MSILLWILLSTFLVSAVAFIGVFSLAIKEKWLEKIIFILVTLSAGALMGGAFLHLIPEAVELSEDIFLYVLVGFSSFFFIEKILHWRHCHKEKCPVHSFAYMNLFGDAVHNFIDGLIISAAFISDINLGIITTIAVAMHEIPQEIGDFGVLVFGGFKRAKALSMNFICALTAVLGGLVGYVMSGQIGFSAAFLLPFAAGGFIYISASDLIPEIKQTTVKVGLQKSIGIFMIFVIGILIMYSLKFVVG